MDITIDVNDLIDYQEKLKMAPSILKDFERKYLNTLATMVIQKAMPNTPVDTGRLRRSYKVKKVTTKGDITEITIYNDARSNGMDESYASYVEKGHFTRGRLSWVNGVFMLQIATDEVEANMQAVWDSMFNDFVRRSEL